MARVCDDHRSELLYQDAELPLFDFDWNWPYIVFLPQFNLLYCGVPKAGTTTWVQGRHSISKTGGQMDKFAVVEGCFFLFTDFDT